MDAGRHSRSSQPRATSQAGLPQFGGVPLPLFFDPDTGLIFARLDTHGFKPASIQKLLEKAA